jgi:hypothetical protein
MADNHDELLLTLRRIVHSDPELQEHLFNIIDVNDFTAAVCAIQLASDHKLEHEVVLQAMRSGRKAWIERKRS